MSDSEGVRSDPESLRERVEIAAKAISDYHAFRLDMPEGDPNGILPEDYGAAQAAVVALDAYYAKLARDVPSPQPAACECPECHGPECGCESCRRALVEGWTHTAAVPSPLTDADQETK